MICGATDNRSAEWCARKMIELDCYLAVPDKVSAKQCAQKICELCESKEEAAEHVSRVLTVKKFASSGVHDKPVVLNDVASCLRRLGIRDVQGMSVL